MVTKNLESSAKGTVEDGDKKPLVPKIVNVMDIRSRPRGMTLVHFTADQWKDVTRTLKPTGELPSKSVLIEAVPLPGGNGDMLLGGSVDSREEAFVIGSRNPFVRREEARSNSISAGRASARKYRTTPGPKRPAV